MVPLAHGSNIAAAVSTADVPASLWPQPVGAVEILPVGAYHTHHQAWLDARLDGIGGSDIATIMGSGFESQFGLWLTKTGRRPPIRSTPIMTRGRYAEAMLGQWFADETGLSMRKTGTWARLQLDPDTGRTLPSWMRCNPDRFTNDGGGVEFKAPDTDDWGDLWRYGPAQHAADQAHWCMAVTGLPHWYVVADGGKYGLKSWRLEYDVDRVADMVQRAGAWFWDHVLEGLPPAVDGSEATTRACKESSAKADQLAPFAELPGCAGWARRRRVLKEEIKIRKAELDLIENRFKAGLLTAQTATDRGTPVLELAYYGPDQEHRRFKEPKK
jgi:predicted phage-related endonuclease